MESLTLYEFKLLTHYDQYDLVFIQGEFITSLEEGGRRFSLYALYRFFVEIEYDIAKNKILGKRSFITGELLNKYSNLNF